MKFKIEIMDQPDHSSFKDAEAENLKINIENQPVMLFCSFFNQPYTETHHIKTHLQCGNTIINGAIQLKGFKSLEFELYDENFEPTTIHSFPLAQGLKKYGEYLNALMAHIERTHCVKLPDEINLIANDSMIFEIT